MSISTSSSPRSYKRVRRVLLLLALWIGLASWPSLIYSGDPLTIQNTAQNLWETGTLNVPEIVALDSGERGAFFYQNPRNGLWYNKYGVANTWVTVPVIAIQKWWCGTYRREAVRLILLNILNLLLALALALVLFELAALFGAGPWTCALWVLALFYGTFAWNYLRAQNSEIWQWLAASCFVYALLRWWREGSRKWLAFTYIALTCLVLFKTVFVLWALVLGGALFMRQGRQSWGRLLVQALPLAVIALLVLYFNYVRFGDPLASGYTQWQQEADYFSGNMAAGLWGFLTAPDKSVLLYFPPLILALWFWPSFSKRWPQESVFIWALALPLTLAVSKVTNWGGHWAYGPRYLLTVLPLLSVPALGLGSWLAAHRSEVKARLALALVIAVCGLSLWAQVQVNRYDYMVYYEVRDALRNFGAVRAEQSLGRPPFWHFNVSMERWSKLGEVPAFVAEAEREIPPERMQELRFALLRKMKTNLFWIPQKLCP